MSTPPVPTPHAAGGSQLAPLTVVRDAALFDRWWNESADQADLTDRLAALTDHPDDVDIEWGLHSLMLGVIQGDPEGVTWLTLHGLNDAAHLRWVGLDLDPSFDGDGKLDGTTVAFSAHIALPDDLGLHFVYETTYVEHPRSILVPPASDPREAIAALIDRAIDLINDSLAERDELIVARQQITAPPSTGGAAELSEQTIRGIVDAAAAEVIATADLPETGARDALNLMANIVLHRLFTDRSAELDDIAQACYSVSFEEVLSWIDG